MDKRSYTNTYKDVDMPISTVGYYLAKWKFTSKKPIKRAYERKDSAIKAWLEDEYPKIKKEAKKDDADIWWAEKQGKTCDLMSQGNFVRTACQNLANNLKGYAPIGSKIKPILTYTAKKRL